MEWIFAIVAVAVPLLLNILAVVFFRRAYRAGALFVLPFIAFASAVDLYSASQKGNLTGLLTILVSGPSLVALSLLGIGNLVDRALRGREDRSGRANAAGATVVRAGADQYKSVQGLARRQMAVLGALVGAAMGGVLLGGPAVFLARVFGGVPNYLLPVWLVNHTAGPLAWLSGGALGAVAGAGFAWLSGWKQKP